MSDLKLEEINLNLLVSLNVLLKEKNVTRAARKLGVTQSAMSHSLRRLRDMFDDELLVQGSGGMVLTPRAERLSEPLHDELLELERVVRDEARFDPATAQRTFRIATSDFVGMVIIPPLLDIVTRESERVELLFRPIELERVAWQLETGELAMNLGVGLEASVGLRRRKLFEDDFVCVARSGHPEIVENLDLETYLSLSHMLISPTSEGEGVVDSVLAEMNRARRVTLKVPFFAAAPMLIARSDLILTAPRRMVEQIAPRFELELYEPPLHLPRFAVVATWHERFDRDEAHRWLREAVMRAAAMADRCDGAIASIPCVAPCSSDSAMCK